MGMSSMILACRDPLKPEDVRLGETFTCFGAEKAATGQVETAKMSISLIKVQIRASELLITILGSPNN
jgi:hypothetical protein